MNCVSGWPASKSGDESGQRPHAAHGELGLGLVDVQDTFLPAGIGLPSVRFVRFAPPNTRYGNKSWPK